MISRFFCLLLLSRESRQFRSRGRDGGTADERAINQLLSIIILPLFERNGSTAFLGLEFSMGFLILKGEIAKRGLDEMEPLSNISNRTETVSLSLLPRRYKVYRKRKGTNIETNVQFNGA